MHKVGETRAGIVVRGARILATLAPFADEIAVYPAHPLPSGAEAYALAFSIPVDTPGLLFLCRDSAATPGAHVFDRPLSTRFDEQDAFVIFDDVEIPRERLFLDGRIDLYNTRHHDRPARQHDEPDHASARSPSSSSPTGSPRRMAEAIGDASPATQEMLGELLDYVEVTRSAVLLSAEHGRRRGRGGVVPRRPAPRAHAVAPGDVVSAGERDHHAHRQPQSPGHAEPPASSTTACSVRCIDEFLHGAKGVDAEERAALFRLAWDFVGSSLAGRNVLYERFYLTSAARNRINHHLRNVDRSRAYALVDGILAAGRKAGGPAGA